MYKQYIVQALYIHTHLYKIMYNYIYIHFIKFNDLAYMFFFLSARFERVGTWSRYTVRHNNINMHRYFAE